MANIEKLPASGAAPPVSSKELQGPRWEKLELIENLGAVILRHGVFLDVAGHQKTLTGTDFSYSRFDRCYFHGTTFERCNFTGCRFHDCNFRGAKLVSCNFNYATFDGCILPPKEIIASAPAWPNVKRDLMQILRANAESVGDYEAQKAFIREEMQAYREHLRRARSRKEDWYRTHYKGVKSWSLVRLESAALWLDRSFLGYGEHFWRAAAGIGVLILTLALFMAISTEAWAHDPRTSEIINHFWNCVLYSIDTLLEIQFSGTLAVPTIFGLLLAGLRYLILGVIVASLARRLAHR